MLPTPDLHEASEFDEAYRDREATFCTGLLAFVLLVGTPARYSISGRAPAFYRNSQCDGIPAIGVEGAQYAVGKARSRAPGINVICCDLGERLPIVDGSIANIVLHQVIDHLDQQRLDRLWGERSRVMKDGGTMFVYSPSRRNVRECNERTHINMLLPSELPRQLGKAGFAILREPNEGLWWMGGQTPDWRENRAIGTAFPPARLAQCNDKCDCNQAPDPCGPEIASRS